MFTIIATENKLYDEYYIGQSLEYNPSFPVNASNRKLSLSDLTNSDYLKLTFLYPCLYGMLVSIIVMVFQSIAIKLNNLENHRTHTTFANRLVLKAFSFQFVTVFTSLYYYAFWVQGAEQSYFRITTSIFALMTVGQWFEYRIYHTIIKLSGGMLF